MRTSTTKKVVKMVQLALLIALVFVLQMLGSFIKIGPLPMSFVLVPIVIGAFLLGWREGAFLGFVFCNVSRLWTADAEGFVTVMEKQLLANGESVEVAVKYSATSGLIPVCVMAVSAVLMAICGLISKVAKQTWMNDYALPISLVGGMAAAIPITAWLG